VGCAVEMDDERGKRADDGKNAEKASDG